MPEEGNVRMSARKPAVATLASLCALAGGLLFGAAPASAKLGFGYSFSFNAPEPFSNALAAAVDQSNGDVYVSDFGTNRLWKFTVNPVTKTAEPERAFGKEVGGVPTGHEGYVEAPNTAFQPAVDSYPGGEEDVLVPEIGGGDVVKYDPKGEPVVLATPIVGLNLPTGVGVDEGGFIYVAELGGTVRKFNASGEPVNAVGTPVSSSENAVVAGLSGTRALAVDSTGEHIYAATETGVVEYNLSGGSYVPGVTFDGGKYTDGVAISPAPAPSAGDILVEARGEVLEYEPSGGLLSQFGGGVLSGGAARMAAYGAISGTIVYAPNEGAGVAVLTERVLLEAPVTKQAGAVTATTAVLNGELNPNVSATAGYEFAYNTNGGCEGGLTTPPSPEKTGQGIQVSELVEGLEGNTEYAFCVIATRGESHTETSPPGAVETFVTAPVAPHVAGESASGTPFGATLEAKVNPENQPTTSCEFQYGKTAVSEHSAPCAPASVEGLAEQTVTASVSGLEPATTYRYRLVVGNPTGAATGAGVEEQKFTTAALEKPVFEGEISYGETPFEATLVAAVNPNYQETSCEFEYSSEESVVVAGEGKRVACQPANLGSGHSGVVASAVVTGLMSHTLYYYRVVAENETGATRGEPIGSFNTQVAVKPVIESESVSYLSAIDATLAAHVNPDYQATTVTVEYSTSEEAVEKGAGTKVSGAAIAAGLGGGQQASVDLGDALAPNTTYYYRVLAQNEAGETSPGSVQEFLTLIAPALTTSAAQNITENSATLSGTINPEDAEASYHYVYTAQTSYVKALAAAAEAGDGAFREIDPLFDPYAGGAGTPEVTISAEHSARSPLAAQPVPLTGLVPGAEYHYALVATTTQQAGGRSVVTTVMSAGATFKVPGATVEALPEEPTFTPAPAPVLASTLTGPAMPLLTLPNIAFPTEEGSTPAAPKPLTRAQKLTAALKACKKQHSKRKRVACEKQARAKYGTKAKKASHEHGSKR
jgi:hypothetical protein